MDRGAWWVAIHGVAKSQTRLHLHFSLSCIGEGNGNPLQCSCLETPRDGGACWAAVSGVAQSWTWLKRLSSSSDYITSSWRLARGVLFLPASDAYVRSFLCLLYSLIKLYYTKALSNQASSLVMDWILLLWRPSVPVSFCGSATTFHYDFSAVVWKPSAAVLQAFHDGLCRGISKMKSLTWLSVVHSYPSLLRKQGHCIIQFTGVWIGIT